MSENQPVTNQTTREEKLVDEIDRETAQILCLCADDYSMMRVRWLTAELEALRAGMEWTEEDRKKAMNDAMKSWEEDLRRRAEAQIAVSRLKYPPPVILSWLWRRRRGQRHE